jgi:hypothetical protein
VDTQWLATLSWHQNDFSEKIPHLNKRSKYHRGALISSEKPANPFHLKDSVGQARILSFFHTSITVLWKQLVCEEMAGSNGALITLTTVTNSVFLRRSVLTHISALATSLFPLKPLPISLLPRFCCAEKQDFL